MSLKFTGLLLLGILLSSMPFIACHGGDSSEPVSAPHNDTTAVDTSGLPKFVNADYIESQKIHRISKLRSSIGHDYWDDFEHCRSMKHYFEPKDSIDWSAIKIYSPVKGTIVKMTMEWAGAQVQIQSDAYPAFFFIIFHINLSNPLNVGDTVQAGQQLGTHIGSQTMSDIAVGTATPAGWKLVSYFEVLTDSVFQKYQARGLHARSDAIISKQARDADTLQCSGDSFQNTGTLENWVTLH